MEPGPAPKVPTFELSYANYMELTCADAIYHEVMHKNNFYIQFNSKFPYA